MIKWQKKKIQILHNIDLRSKMAGASVSQPLYFIPKIFRTSHWLVAATN